MSATGVTCVALIAVPLSVGAVTGLLVRRSFGGRQRGFIASLGCVVVPTVAALGLAVQVPIVGLWDAALAGLLFGLGVFMAAHQALADGRNATLFGVASLLSLFLLEIGVRLLLPRPPGFPRTAGPHLLLANALESDIAVQPWDTRCKEVVCSISYGDQYPGIFNRAEAQQGMANPRLFRPNPNARRRVLHVGDSMTYGYGLTREDTFTADLERLEPDVQHINAAIPATAPDAYLAVLQSWVAVHEIDLVVMHIFEGNDLSGLDSRYPCCGWQSLLAYDGAGAALRCSTATVPDLRRAGFLWLAFHAPPPFLVRALVHKSSAAAYLGAALTIDGFLGVDQPDDTRLEHLSAIFRSAKNLLAKRNIPLVIDVLPDRSWLDGRGTYLHHAPRILEAAQRNGVRAIDASGVLHDAIGRGQNLFFDDGDDGNPHYNASGHALLATWLHDQLRAAPLQQATR